MSQSIRENRPYIKGLGISWASNTTLTVAAGECSNSTNAYDLRIASALTLNAAVVGANGIDTGALANSTVYNVFAIWQQVGFSVPAVILSTSATPIYPNGYDICRRIGYAVTDGSAHFLLIYQFGSGEHRKYVYDAALSVLSGGASASYAAVDLSAAVPVVSTPVTFQAILTPTAADDVATVRPSGSASTTHCTISGVVAAKIQQMQIIVPSLVVSGVPKVDYIVTGTLSLLVSAFEDYL